MRIRILDGRKRERFVQALENRGASDLSAVEGKVRRMVNDVRRNGDRALRRYAAKFDGLLPKDPIRMPKASLDQAWNASEPTVQEAIRQAAGNIQRYCELQKPKEWRQEISPGVCVGQLIRPIDSVGCYVPAGRYPLPSTVLMTVIPAQVAGVRRIVVVSPRAARVTLAAAAYLGVDEFYQVGGVQAIAALAFGTESLARVDKIVGPGNQYVTAAKKLVAFDCAIEFLAGPTEAVVISEHGKPEYIASDLIAQAEHDPQALSIFVTNSRRLANAVQSELQQRVRTNPTAAASLSKKGAILLVDSLEEAVSIANRIAPEHLTIPGELVDAVQNAGSVFLNEFSPQAAGDYVSGPNHVLPTGGMARVRGGLSVLDFLRVIACQEVTPNAMKRIAPAAIALAEAEGLKGHAESLRARYSNA